MDVLIATGIVASILGVIVWVGYPLVAGVVEQDDIDRGPQLAAQLMTVQAINPSTNEVVDEVTDLAWRVQPIEARWRAEGYSTVQRVADRGEL
jgi:hypothetical protein